MKNRPFTMRTKVLLSIYVGLISLFAIYTISYSALEDQIPGNGLIDQATAQQYIENFNTSDEAIPANLQGMTIDLSQFYAMQKIKKDQQEIAGFTVYFGKDDNMETIGLIVGLDRQGQHIPGTFFRTNAGELASIMNEQGREE